MRVAAEELVGKTQAASDDRPWVIATQVMLVVVGLILAALVVTGVLLFFQYRPNVLPAYARVFGISSSVSSDHHWRTIHRDASRLLFPAFAALFTAAVGLALVRHRPARLLWPILAGVMVLGATFTGYLLPWDELGLWRAAVGENFSGYQPILFGHDVKFVLIGNREIGTSTLARWVWVHSVGVTVMLIAFLVVIGLQTRRPRERAASTAVAPEQ